VRWGRIGTTGQTLTKTFETAAEASAATERLIGQKRDKGYAEVSPDEAKRAAPRPFAFHAPPAQLDLFALVTEETAVAPSSPIAPVAGGLFD